jgi:2-methylcitrate dehydratase PrpD
MPFLVCVALLDGSVNLRTFDEERFLDDDVRNLMACTSVQGDPAFSAQAPATRNCRIRGELAGGEWIESHLIRASRPDLAQGKSERAIEEKFFELVEPRLGAKQARRLADALWEIEGADGVGQLIELTAIQGKNDAGGAHHRTSV